MLETCLKVSCNIPIYTYFINGCSCYKIHRSLGRINFYGSEINIKMYIKIYCDLLWKHIQNILEQLKSKFSICQLFDFSFDDLIQFFGVFLIFRCFLRVYCELWGKEVSEEISRAQHIRNSSNNSICNEICVSERIRLR